MGLFGSREAKTFELRPELRADIRSIIERAPSDASKLMRTAAAEPAMMALSSQLPADEHVGSMVYCLDAASFAKGYLALTDSRIVVSLQPENGKTKVLAIPLPEVSKFTFDSGMAFLYFGLQDRRLDLGFPGGGPYSQAVCKEIKTAVDKFHSDPYAL
jgi:hypothetical protein